MVLANKTNGDKSGNARFCLRDRVAGIDGNIGALSGKSGYNDESRSGAGGASMFVGKKVWF